MELKIVKQGVAGGLVMMALFRSDSATTKELCVYALFNLLCDPLSRIGLMREEVAYKLPVEFSRHIRRTRIKSCTSTLDSVACCSTYLFSLQGDKAT